MIRKGLLLLCVLIGLGACSAQSSTNFATPIANRVAPHQDASGSDSSQPDVADLQGSQVQVILVTAQILGKLG